MNAPIQLPDNWRHQLEDFAGQISKSRIAKFFGVSSRVIDRWTKTNEDFEKFFADDAPLPMNHDAPLRDRITGLIGCHDSTLVKTLQVPVPDLVIVLNEADRRIGDLEGERRRLASELNRRDHAAHVCNARGIATHQRPAGSSGAISTT